MNVVPEELKVGKCVPRMIEYRKNPNSLDTRKNCCNYPKL